MPPPSSQTSLAASLLVCQVIVAEFLVGAALGVPIMFTESGRFFSPGVSAAGFAVVRVVDSGKDLNAYAKVDTQAGCCSPAMAPGSLPLAADCSPALGVHRGLAELLSRYNESTRELALPDVVKWTSTQRSCNCGRSRQEWIKKSP